VTQGRFLRRGLTWKTGVLALVFIVAGLFALAALARRSQPEYPMTANVIDTRIVGPEFECSWEVDLEFRNDSDRRLSLKSVELVDVEDSRKGYIGGFDPADSIVRTYQYALVDCLEPSSAQLIARYGPTLTKQERSVTIAID